MIHLIALFLFASITVYTRTIVLFHGLGDSCCNQRIDHFTRTLSALLPSGNATKYYSIMIGDTVEEDRRRSFFDDANRQVDLVCKKLVELDGFDAIGVSQGGLLLRAVVTRCEGLKMRRLITLGSPHLGITAAPGCDQMSSEPKRWCRVVQRIIESSAYSPLIRYTVIPAQYYRNPKELTKYLRYNRFLADINQERRIREDYKRRLLQLERLVLYKFSNDTVLVPSSSAWFGYMNNTTNYNNMIVERIGISEMMQQGKVHLKVAQGGHSKLSFDTMKSIANDLQ